MMRGRRVAWRPASFSCDYVFERLNYLFVGPPVYCTSAQPLLRFLLISYLQQFDQHIEKVHVAQYPSEATILRDYQTT